MITQEELKNLTYYKEGRLYARDRIGQRIKKDDVLGSLRSCGRYRDIGLNYKNYREHRLIWLYHYGCIPKYIDHIDRDGLNNRIENLRECTASQNNANQTRLKNNTTGYRGVYKVPRTNKYAAQVYYKKVKYHLGCYSTAEEAGKVAALKRKELYEDYYNDE